MPGHWVRYAPPATPPKNSPNGRAAHFVVLVARGAYESGSPIRASMRAHPGEGFSSSTRVRIAERAKLRTGAGFSTWRARVSLTRIYRASLALNQDVPAWCSLHRVFDCVSLCQWMIRTGMALAPDIGLLLTCEIDKYIDPVASERVHELDGVLHYRNPMPMCSARNGGEAELGPRLLATSVGRRSPAGISGCAWRCRPRR